MRNLFLRIVTLMIATVIPGTLLVAVIAQPANAGVAREPATRVEAVAVKIMAKARIDAMNDPGTVLNYATAVRVFSTSAASPYGRYAVDWRRQFAAGARQSGVRITNINAAENKAVETRRRQIWGSSCPQCRHADGTLRKPVNAKNPTPTCGTGLATGPIEHRPLWRGRFKYSTYLNSCQTDLLILNWRQGCVAAGGAAAGVFALVKRLRGNALSNAMIAFLGWACWSEADVIERYQKASNVRAIIMRSNPDAYAISNPNGSQFTDIGYYSQ